MSSSRLASRALGVLLAPVLVMAALAAAPPGNALHGPADTSHQFLTATAPLPITDGLAGCGGPLSAPIQLQFNVAGLPSKRITEAWVRMDLVHSYVGDLRMTLTAPNGVTATVLDPGGCNGDSSNVSGTYLFWDDSASPTLNAAAGGYTDGQTVPSSAFPGYKPSENLTNAFAGLTNPNGTWTLSVWDRAAVDTGTVGGNMELGFYIDRTAPTTTITSSPADGSAAGPVEFEFSGTDNHPVGVTAFNCSIDGGPFNACSSPFTTNVEPGSHSFAVQAVDGSSNTDATPDLYTWETAAAPDTTPPDTAITGGPADGDTVGVLPSYAFNSPDDNTATFECSFDGGSYAPCTSPYQVAGGTSPGAHTFAVRAKDPAGNVDPTPSSRDFTYDPTPPDTTPPQTNIIGGPENGAGVKSPPTYRFASPDADADGFRCSVDDKAFKPCTTPFTVSGIAPGNHTFEVSAVDEAGNVDPTPALRTFKLRDLCAEAKAKLRQARIKLREAIEDGASKRKIRRLRGQVNKWKAEVRDLC